MKQIGTDFQGLPIYAMNLKEILEKLMFKDIGDNKFELQRPELLDCYPLLLEDDGMGYGVRPMFIGEANRLIYEDKDSGLNVFNLFRYENRNNKSDIME